MEDAHARPAAEVIELLESDATRGLSDSQVAAARARYGHNELAADPGTPLWKLVLKQFDDLLVKILVGAAAVDCAIAWIGGEGAAGLVEPGVIVLILIANATVGVVTETRAEAAIEALKVLEAEDASVLRGGAWRTLPSAELVPGDIVEVATGNKVPADVRVLELQSSQLRADQSALTGESESVRKIPDPVRDPGAVYQDKTCVLFSGTVVTAGRCRGVVFATGAATAIGRIRDALAETSQGQTPLQKKLDGLGELLSKIIAAVCVLVWVVSIPHFADPVHGGRLQGALYYFKIAVALAVAAIPEGLPAVVTTCLALGARKMARRNAIVRKLPSVETLGCTTVICSDKTGTLTTNQMSVSRVATVDDVPAAAPAAAAGAYAAFGAASGGLGASAPGAHQPPLVLLHHRVEGTTYAPSGRVLSPDGRPLDSPAGQSQALRVASAIGALCNESRLRFDARAGRYEHRGEATEVALRVLAEKLGGPSLEPVGDAAAAARGRALSARPPGGTRDGGSAGDGGAPSGTPANDAWCGTFRTLRVLEFTRDRRRMSALVAAGPGSAGASREVGPTDGALPPPSPMARAPRFLLVKGAPESVLPRCEAALAPGGGRVKLDDAARASLLGLVERWGVGEALRVLALAFKEVAVGGPPGTPGDPDEAGAAATAADEDDLTLAALVGLRDPPRPEARAALQACAAAGIRVVMITGDNPATARSVAKAVGLLPADEGDRFGGGADASAAGDREEGSGGRALGRDGGDPADAPPPPATPPRNQALAPISTASGKSRREGAASGSPPSPLSPLTPPHPGRCYETMTGREFERLGPEAAAAAARSLRVLARVEPQHKTRLVTLLKEAGEVVAMTGDGVNDAPALRRADIGVAMGSGTAVARGAADVVLADDDFATIVAAVASGRAIFDNTRAFIRYMISSNIGEVVAIFAAALLGLPEILNPVQLLWVNLVTDGPPATALSFNPAEPGIMSRRPRGTEEGVVDGWMLFRYLAVGAYVGLATVGGFAWGFLGDPSGPRLSWGALRAYQSCTADAAAVAASHGGIDLAAGGAARRLLEGVAPCSAFEVRVPSTIAVTVLVVVEMFNALNALSEDGSLLVAGPLRNPALLAAIALSLLLHGALLYVPALAATFGVVPLGWDEWRAVLALSVPVVLLDELLKLVSRARARKAGERAGQAGSAGSAPGLLASLRAAAPGQGPHRKRSGPAALRARPAPLSLLSRARRAAAVSLRNVASRALGPRAALYVPIPRGGDDGASDREAGAISLATRD